MEITVTLIETHTNEETFKIKELPDNWDEMSRWDQYSYIGEHGDYIESYTELFHVEDVLEIKEEGNSPEKDFVFVDFTNEGKAKWKP